MKKELFVEQDGLVLRPAELTEVVEFKRPRVEVLATEYWGLLERDKQFNRNEYHTIFCGDIPNPATGFAVEQVEIGVFNSASKLDKIRGLGLTLRLKLTRDYLHTILHCQQLEQIVDPWDLRLTRLVFAPHGIGFNLNLQLVRLDGDSGGKMGPRNWQALKIFEQAVLLTTTADLLTTLIASYQTT